MIKNLNQMLPIQHRLTKREDFALVYANGSYVAVNGIGMKFLKRNTGQTRIGFPVGKNYSKKATDRNRARRLLREATRSNLALLKSGYDLTIMIRPEKKDLRFEELSKTIKELFKKANLLI